MSMIDKNKEYTCLINPNFQLSKQYPKYFELIDELIILFDKIQEGVSRKGIKPSPENLFQIIVLVSGPKTMNSVLSISHLCDQGLTEDARSVLRKILEVSATLLYLKRDIAKFEDRVNRFYHFGSIENKKTLVLTEKYPERFSEYIVKYFDEKKQDFEDAYNSIKQYYPCRTNGEIRGEFRRHWDGKSLTRIILESGMSKEMVPFSVFSHSTHFSAADISYYLNLESGEVYTKHNLDEVPHLLINTMKLSGQVVQFLNLEFKLGLDRHLREIQERVSKAEKVLNS